MKKEKSLKSISIKAIVFSVIVIVFVLFCDPLCLTFNVLREDELFFSFFTLAAPRYDYAPEDFASIYYGVNTIIVLLAVGTLIFSILALLNQKGKMVNATKGIAKALKTFSTLTLVLGALFGNIVNVAYSFIILGGNGVIGLIDYFIILILVAILNKQCKNYKKRIIPAKEKEFSDEK